MSMKRSKEVTRGRQRDVEGGFWEKKGPERVYTYEGDIATQPDESFTPYAPGVRYAKDALITHPKFGKGIVTDLDGQKIDVLFQDGPRKLTHGLGGGAVLPPPKPKPAPEPVIETTEAPTTDPEPNTDKSAGTDTDAVAAADPGADADPSAEPN